MIGGRRRTSDEVVQLMHNDPDDIAGTGNDAADPMLRTDLRAPL